MTPALATAPALAPQRRCETTAKSSDSALMTRIADGDVAAFDELYRRHHRRVLMQARKLCASREVAEEVAQEAFLSLWRGAHAYRPGSGSVGAWLSSMVRNRAIDAWRCAAVRPVSVEMVDNGAGQLPATGGPEPAVPERALALSLIGELPAPQKEAVFLAYFGDMTHSEIAAHAGAPLGTIKGRIRLGLERMRPGLENSSRELALAA
ncbi:MAG TPA: RNA polymerase sigma factor [Solirubrobacteraceae bacterium]|nr:RNA polymerase sigma factor [Solirubrobacteraceae bacterium]